MLYAKLLPESSKQLAVYRALFKACGNFWGYLTHQDSEAICVEVHLVPVSQESLDESYVTATICAEAAWGPWETLVLKTALDALRWLQG